MSIEYKIEKLIEESLLDFVKKNPATTTAGVAGAAGMGYGIGNGSIKRAFDYTKEHTPQEIGQNISSKIGKVWDSFKTTKVGDMIKTDVADPQKATEAASTVAKAITDSGATD